MEWKRLDRLPKRTLDNLHILMKGVKGDDLLFYVDIIKGQSGFDRVVKWLDSLRTKQGNELTIGTKNGYISAVRRAFSEINEDYSLYKSKVREYDAIIKTKKISTGREYEQSKDVLNRLMYKESKTVAAIAGLIYYACPETKMQINYLMVTRIDVNNGVDNYLDLDNCLFVYHPPGYLEESCCVPEEYVDFIKSLELNTWLLESKRTSAQSLSNMFKRTAKCSYTTLRKMYLGNSDDRSSDSDAVELPATQPVVAAVTQPVVTAVTQPVVTAVTQPVVTVTQPVVTAVTQPVAAAVTQPVVSAVTQPVVSAVTQPVVSAVTQLVVSKQKIVITMKKYHGIPWDSCTDDDCGNTTNDMRRKDLLRLQLELFGKDDLFYYELFLSAEAYGKIMRHLTEIKKYKPNTICKYLAAILKMLSQTDCGVVSYRRYLMIWLAAKRAADAHQEQIPELEPGMEKVVKFTDVYKIAQSVYDDTNASVVSRIYALVILQSIDWKSDKAIGILRVSDLINTKFEDDGKSSLINLEVQRWEIIAGMTKNKDSRSIMLSDTFMWGLSKICKGQLQGYLLGREYKAEDAARIIQSSMGYGPREIRASYVTHLYTENIPMNVFCRISKNMGHNYRTSLTDYVRIG